MKEVQHYLALTKNELDLILSILYETLKSQTVKNTFWGFLVPNLNLFWTVSLLVKPTTSLLAEVTSCTITKNKAFFWGGGGGAA